MKLFISPHHDDAALFGAFTLIREKPLVITVFDSYEQPRRDYPGCTNDIRSSEDTQAISGVLGCNLSFLGFRDDRPDWDGIERELRKINGHAEEVYAPAIENGGHHHHNKVGEIAQRVFGERVRHYLTYTSHGKSVSNTMVPFEPHWVLLKLKALACYASQIGLEDCCPHFMRPQYEYYQDHE
jgi:LmbE family N-acetylglucosaminyl deacetylase